MKKTLLEKTADKLVDAFVNDKIIAPLPTKFTKKLSEAQKLRKLCESKVKDPMIGFKAAGTGIPVMKKLKEKKPFYASIFKKNFIKSGKKVKINKSTLGIELEVCYLVKKNFFLSKGSITIKNVSKFISHMAPCIEVVGYRQRKKGIKSFGDLCSDFGANVKFLIGQKKKYKKINIENLKTTIKEIQGNGIQVVALTEKSEELIYTSDLKDPVAILMGSEEDGVSYEYLKLADHKIKLPINGKIDSLNVSVACAVALYEAVRQRA